jgi:hypothetical protein
VQLLERVDEAVVVAAFLEAELDSERFGEALRDALVRLGTDERLVRDADLGDPTANALRSRALDDYRGGYLGRNLDGLVWWRAALEPAEVLAVRFIAWDWWLEITGGSRLPGDAAASSRSRGEQTSFPSAAPPLIVVRADPVSHLMVVEGHSRLEAYARQPERLPPQLEVLLGEGERIRAWSLY